MSRIGSSPFDVQIIRQPAWLAGKPVLEAFRIPNTKLSSVDPPKFKWGIEGPRAKVDDWCGATLRRTGSWYIIAAQGGHNGYYGNEVDAIRLTADAPAWEELRAHSPESALIGDFSFENPSGSGQYDFSRSTGIYLDGTPCARHGYTTTQYLDSIDRIVLIGNGGCSIHIDPGQGELHTIGPGPGLSIAVDHAAAFVRHMHARSTAYRGGAFWPVTTGSSPGEGEVKVSAKGVYTFNARDVGTEVALCYQYGPGQRVGWWPSDVMFNAFRWSDKQWDPPDTYKRLRRPIANGRWACRDPRNDDLFVPSAGDELGASRIRRWRVTTNNWEVVADSFGYLSSYYPVVDPKRNYLYMFAEPLNFGGRIEIGVDFAVKRITLTGPAAAEILNSLRETQPVYDPINDCFWVLYAPVRPPALLYRIRASDLFVERVIPTGVPLPIRGNGVQNSVQYVPELKGLVWCYGHNDDLLFIRTT